MNFYINRNLTEFRNIELHGKLANETYAANLGGGSTTTGTKMCTRTRGIALGCSVWNSYATNQIVQEADLTAIPTRQVINFNISSMPSGAMVVLNAMSPTTDFWPAYAGTSTKMSASDAFWTLLDAMDASPYPDSRFGKDYFPQDMTFDEWRNSSWCGCAWECYGDGFGYTTSLSSTKWYSFVSIVSNKFYSVSSTFQLTPGNKSLNWTQSYY